MFKFQIGEVVRDIVTDFEGVVMGRTEYATGCRHYGLQVQFLNKDGRINDYEWLDEQRLMSVGRKVLFIPTYESGPFPTPPSL